jgi:hypothetical protein
MQIFEVWNDFLRKFLEFSLVFSIFLFFVNFQKVQNFNSNSERLKIKSMNSILEISKKNQTVNFQKFTYANMFCEFSKIFK